MLNILKNILKLFIPIQPIKNDFLKSKLKKLNSLEEKEIFRVRQELELEKKKYQNKKKKEHEKDNKRIKDIEKKIKEIAKTKNQESNNYDKEMKYDTLIAIYLEILNREKENLSKKQEKKSICQKIDQKYKELWIDHQLLKVTNKMNENCIKQIENSPKTKNKSIYSIPRLQNLEK